MKNCNIAILGATGAVGREMLNVLEEYDIPVSRLKLLSSARSAGSKIPFRGEALTVEEATDASFEGMDFVLGAVKSGMSRAFAPAIVKSGAVYIDNSSAFRMDPAIPLVVPEINGEDAKSNSGIIANPNCSTHHHRDGRRRAQPPLADREHGRVHVSGRIRCRAGRT